MRRLSTMLSLIAAVFIAAACSSTSAPKVQADYDPSVDFSQFRTYNFFNPMGIENAAYSSILGQMFRDAISRELNARGYRLADNPDLLLNVSGKVQDKTKVTTYNDPAPYYGYRAGYYDPWYGYGYGSSTHVSQYSEGTVNVDMVDAKAKRMVWEGVAIGRMQEDRTNAEVQQLINSAIAEMFATYPFKAAN